MGFIQSNEILRTSNLLIKEVFRNYWSVIMYTYVCLLEENIVIKCITTYYEII